MKSQLLEKVNSINYENTFTVNKIICAKGSIPFCLAYYYPDLNPIELVWGDIKGEFVHNSMHTVPHLSLIHI